ncbi:MAG: hypothetical protein FWF92_11575 [Oscillospiraceae bacterium]|nr:hypothetical protein [Oscillospiraceae bacterium]
MLIGKYKYAIDSKNRICIPHKFRGDLGVRCVLSRDVVDKCLNLYSMGQWEIFSEKIEQLPTIKMKKVRQYIYSNSYEVEIDSQGRIVLNEQFCEDKDLRLLTEKEVMIIGNHTHAQIWNVTEWEDFNGKLNAEENRESIINDLLEVGF